MNFAKCFQRDPEICGGETILKGTRVTLRTVLASLADGSSFEQIVEDFPSLTENQLRAVVAFAAASAKEDLPTQVLPAAGRESNSTRIFPFLWCRFSHLTGTTCIQSWTKA
jgi:uncharacterized protein (DUF433 family)